MQEVEPCAAMRDGGMARQGSWEGQAPLAGVSHPECMYLMPQMRFMLNLSCLLGRVVAAACKMGVYGSLFFRSHSGYEFGKKVGGSMPLWSEAENQTNHSEPNNMLESWAWSRNVWVLQCSVPTFPLPCSLILTLIISLLWRTSQQLFQHAPIQFNESFPLLPTWKMYHFTQRKVTLALSAWRYLPGHIHVGCFVCLCRA